MIAYDRRPRPSKVTVSTRSTIRSAAAHWSRATRLEHAARLAFERKRRNARLSQKFVSRTESLGAALALTGIMDDIRVSFPGGKRVDAQVGNRVVHTDQPTDLGGDDTAVAPYDLFLASLATCAGIYALGFCQSRGLSTEGLSLRQSHTMDPETHLLSHVGLELTLPADFPEKYRAPVLRALESCKVKRTLGIGVTFAVGTSEPAAAAG